MEITKREIIVSISIASILMLLGFIISGKISETQMDANEKYNKAVKITDSEQFEYAMSTNIGNAFVYGDLVAVDTVGFLDIQGEYMSVTKITEEYTRHTHWVNDYDEEGNYEGSHEEEYWTWDVVDEEQKECKKVTFLGVEFDYFYFTGMEEEYIETQLDNMSSRTRYKYYGSDIKHTGTIFTCLRDGIISNNTYFYHMTIDETIEHLQSEDGLIAFWVMWIIVIVGCVYGFCYLENRWLK